MIEQKLLDQLIAMTLLAMMRTYVKNVAANPETDPAQFTPALRKQFEGIIEEHCNHQQAVELAAHHIAGQVARMLMDITKLSYAVMGELDMDALIASTEEFCTLKLGHPVKV